ncbi:hypothetical protein PISMIDRAFT_671454 [Pisolithus microcarpus 441]|uniref:Uncharacterized protein n=1 Tax=Pisolithus microcarpus 441 TaxID=765257 RepID=A0A0C9YYQ6_9AGAM|nr:hypothetical protein PISMIDRAFT_671454 [Pisolithus microcarpus 441]
MRAPHPLGILLLWSHLRPLYGMMRATIIYVNIHMSSLTPIPLTRILQHLPELHPLGDFHHHLQRTLYLPHITLDN